MVYCRKLNLDSGCRQLEAEVFDSTKTKDIRIRLKKSGSSRGVYISIHDWKVLVADMIILDIIPCSKDERRTFFEDPEHKFSQKERDDKLEEFKTSLDSINIELITKENCFRISKKHKNENRKKKGCIFEPPTVDIFILGMYDLLHGYRNLIEQDIERCRQAETENGKKHASPSKRFKLTEEHCEKDQRGQGKEKKTEVLDSSDVGKNCKEKDVPKKCKRESTGKVIESQPLKPVELKNSIKKDIKKTLQKSVYC